jgi:hypothetical protein
MLGVGIGSGVIEGNAGGVTAGSEGGLTRGGTAGLPPPTDDAEGCTADVGCE